MVSCTKCGIEYDDGKKFCKKCGTALVTQAPLQENKQTEQVSQSVPKGDTLSSVIPEKQPAKMPQEKLICPNCRSIFESGKFCKKCGTNLGTKTLSREGRDGRTFSYSKKERKFPSSITIAAGVAIFLLAAAGYLFWPKYSYLIKKQTPSGAADTAKTVPSPSSSPRTTTPPPSAPETGTRETDHIKTLLENIRKANLQKNIDLFMSCYSQDFTDREGKRIATIENWKNQDYKYLSWIVKSETLTGNSANIKVEWLITTSPRSGGQPEEGRMLLDVTLVKENGDWKIRETKIAD